MRSAILAGVLLGVFTARDAHAEPRQDCWSPIRPGIGVSVGRSVTPYFEFSPGTFGSATGASTRAGGGLHLGGRFDAPIAGPWRGRVEGARATWPVTRETYGSGALPTTIERVGDVTSRQLVALVGRQAGRSGACGYVLAGGGLYGLGVDGTRLRHRGLALAAGMDIQLRHRSVVQLEAQVHVIETRGRPPIPSGVLAANLSVGWLYRF